MLQLDINCWQAHLELFFEVNRNAMFRSQKFISSKVKSLFIIQRERERV